jgi:3-oxoadipate enol-lactonase
MSWNPKPLDPADVTVHRRGHGKPLILLHCLGMDWHFWDVLEPLADQFELIAYSLPGHHDTKLPAGQYGEAELTEQLRALMIREGVAQAHLAGISMGGSLAQHFAGTYPDMVDRVILCDCTPHYNDEMRANWPVRAGLARKNGVASLIPMLEKVFFTQASLDENGPNVRHVKEKWATCSGEGYALGCEWLAVASSRYRWRAMHRFGSDLRSCCRSFVASSVSRVRALVVAVEDKRPISGAFVDTLSNGKARIGPSGGGPHPPPACVDLRPSSRWRSRW